MKCAVRVRHLSILVLLLGRVLALPATTCLVQGQEAPEEEATVGTPSEEDLLTRLKRTEDDVARLKQSHDEGRDVLTTLRERFEQSQDPSITTVDEQTHKSPEEKAKAKAKHWYERLSIRGYAQFRFNSPLFEEDDSFPAQLVADRSVGDDQNFLIRRARLIVAGDLSDHLYVYLQPDFASTVPGSIDATYFTQIRDWYGDLYIDEDKVNRVRIGQSKVPYGWENMQSSSNRIPLDRSDTLNSAVRNERDLGVFYYWTPKQAQDLFKYVLDQGLKGSGNYGVFGYGVYNGQGGSLLEQNDNLHMVVRLTYPFKIRDDQIVELSVQAYTGLYTVLAAPIRPLGVGPLIRPAGTLETDGRDGIRDERVAGTVVWYPQPYGLQAEWQAGNGPGLNDQQTAVIERSLSGGYVMLFYRWVTERCGTLFPFAKYNVYRGGYKPERNAPFSDIKEWELGLEWQFTPQMELTTQYVITDRTNTVAQATGRSYGQYEGHLFRVQFQINY